MDLTTLVLRTVMIEQAQGAILKNLVLVDENLCAMLDKAKRAIAKQILRIELMDKAKHNERPTDIVLTGTLREEASARALGAILARNPILA